MICRGESLEEERERESLEERRLREREMDREEDIECVER